MQDIQTVKIEDKNYPKSLKNIASAPQVLYYRGNLEALYENCFAVVGTRRPTEYGKQAALQIAGEIAQAGLVIVSGLAPGIDTLAHKACVEINKPTIAVLGTGLDEKNIYPQENLRLAEKIIETGGCLISEYEPGTPGYPANFPARNRIVSALSLGVLVVEAKERSGSLITARFAKKQGKKVFAVPGQIYTLNAKGTNKLIKEGAILAENTQDIILYIQEFAPFTNSIELVNGANDSKKVAAVNKEEKAILTALKEEPLYIDKIIEKTKLSVHVVGSTLALMEISGKIRNLGGNVYAIA